LQLGSKKEELDAKQGELLKSLIKVFPTDEVDHLFFPGISEKSEAHYPCCDISFPLKPHFHTLEEIARKTYEKLSKISKKDDKEKTNVVSAVLCFVISTEPEETVDKRALKQTFITVPINFDSYGTMVLSIDEVFKDSNDKEGSIGDDLEAGKRVARCNAALSVGEETDSKEKIIRHLTTLDLGEKAAEIFQLIRTAKVKEPEKIRYLNSNDVTKSTEHNHSERVLIRALKEPKNIVQIIEEIKRVVKSETKLRGTFTVHSGALLVCSYPNSVCDECGVSFLALQNSYERGFLAEFVKIANTNNSKKDDVKLRTRGFNASACEQNTSEFAVTVIASSNKVFQKDACSKLIASNPEAKYPCREMSYPFASKGINLRRKKSTNCIYEYIEGSTLHRDYVVSVPYAGTVCMSGSKKSKLKCKKTSLLESATRGIVVECNKPAELWQQQYPGSFFKQSNAKRDCVLQQISGLNTENIQPVNNHAQVAAAAAAASSTSEASKPV
jgi:hypothetical protein